jgi:cytochrome c oxidase assembly factor 5
MNSCTAIREELETCVRASACFYSGRTFGECLREKDNKELPIRCQNLRTLLFECRRGQYDMRNRFRGNHFGAEIYVSDDQLQSGEELRKRNASE